MRYISVELFRKLTKQNWYSNMDICYKWAARMQIKL